MAQYIPKDALVAELKFRKEQLERYKNISETADACHDEITSVLSLVDTLEVKEVDLDFEIKEDWLFAEKTEEDCLECMCLTEDTFVSLAKKYFAFGLSASNPITAADKGTAEEIIINLKRVENDYRIDLTKEIEWVMNKVKK